MTASLLGVYFLLLPFMSALAPSEWLPLPLLLLLLVTPWALLRANPTWMSRLLPRDLPLGVMYIAGVVAMAWGPVPAGIKNANYAAAVAVCYGTFFLVARCLVLERGITWAHLGRAARTSLAFLSVAVIVEFVLASVFGVFYSDVIPFAHQELNVANLIDDRFKRPRAFAPEPGFTALAFECLWPLAMIAAPSGAKRWLLNTLYGAAFLLLGSAAGVGCLLVAGLIWWTVRMRDLRSGLLFAGLGAVVVVSLVATEEGSAALWSVFGRKLDILTLAAPEGADGLTVLDRLTTYATGLDLIEAHPLGIGWGTLGQMFADGVWLAEVGPLTGSGMLSLYLDVTVASGAVGLIALLVFIGLRWRSALASRHSAAGCVAVAVMSLSMHHLFITEFQFPFLWLALALADRLALESFLASPISHSRTAPPATLS